MTANDAFWAERREWRRDFHAHPEFGFEERRTSRLVAERLRAFGFTDVVEGVGGTGVVATLTRGSGNRSIALAPTWMRYESRKRPTYLIVPGRRA